ncbi:hypothetical protein B0A55_07395 [Friedmanniomyces simplex]|uniref:Telomere length regulation protein conserved domain-containing protein n=1 Tax=Friedmanniomyces simplex TaxID=329884 RepID=A0A4U0XEY7_9PEZI|nr:hypothetical protein B0A55_07395 [Friedmanniomyces simplex]
MADFLTAVKTARVIPEKEAEAGLTAVKTSKPQPAQDLQKPRGTEFTRKTGTLSSPTSVKDAATPEEALRVLCSQPDAETLLTILRKLSSPDAFPAFHLDAPGPLQAQILNTVVGDTIPSFWPTLQAGEKALVVRCLRNVTGINALLANLRAISSPGSVSKRSDLAGQRVSLIRVTGQVFDGHTVILDLLITSNRVVTDKIRRDLAQKEIVNLFGSGKVISNVAQAEDAARQSDQSGAPAASWLAVGSEYADWLGRNIAALFDQINKISLGMYGEVRGPGGLLLAKALNLGYQSALVKGLVSEVLSRSDDGFPELTRYLPKYAKRQFLERTLRWLSQFCASAGAAAHTGENVSSIAALLTALVQPDQVVCTQHARAICSDPNLTVVLSHPVRRACVSMLSGIAPDELQNLLETLMTTFSDRIFIDHSPVLQQDSIAQTLLLAAGCLHRANPVAVLMIARSSGHMQGTSNRLDTSGQRARWLGMVVATAISGLVDREGSRMEFGVDEVKTEEALWYLNLVKVQDRVGALSDFGALLARQDKAVKPARKLPSVHAKALPSLNGKLVFGPPRPPTPAQTEVIGEKVTELLDDVSDEEDDDLKPYAKPDSDPEDSDGMRR